MNTSKQLRLSTALAAGLTAAMIIHTGAAGAHEAPGLEERGLAQVVYRGAEAAALPQSAVEAAGAYRYYMRSAGGIDAGFTSGAGVARSLRLGASYEPKALTRGAVAYAAIVALQDERFVEGVRRATADAAARQALTSALLSEPHRATVLPGADRAAGLISAALAAEGVRVRDAGRAVKQSAYDVQHQAWSKAEVDGRVARLAEAKTLSLSSLPAPEGDLRALVSYDGEAASTPAQTTVIGRGLALAALAVMGEADEDSARTLMNDPECAWCLRMSKLNLFQCLAVSKPWYEDVFCLGQHGLIDTGECIYAASGSSRLVKAPTLALAPKRDEDGEEEATRLALK
jgi:hypothetical protein